MIARDPFYCESCEEWFKKRGFLEEICEIRAKFECTTPNKANNAKEEGPISISEGFTIKKEATSPRKQIFESESEHKNNIENEHKSNSSHVNAKLIKTDKIQSENPMSFPEIKPNEVHINTSAHASFNFETLLDKLPIVGTRLPVEDLIQMMFFFELLLENLMKSEDSLENKQVAALLRLLATLPFRNQKFLQKILKNFLTDSFLDKEILNKLVMKLASIYGENNNIIKLCLFF